MVLVEFSEFVDELENELLLLLESDDVGLGGWAVDHMADGVLDGAPGEEAARLAMVVGG